MNMLDNISDAWTQRGTPIQSWIDSVKQGHLRPDPNENMLMTKIVEQVLGLK